MPIVLPYADASFRVVASITARRNAVEFRRVLRRDGALLVIVPEPEAGAAPARRARAGSPAAAAPFRHRLVTRRRSRRPPPPPPSQSARRPAGAGSHPRLPESARPALALAGPACRALESGHPGNAPAGLTAGSGGGRKQALHRLGSRRIRRRVSPKYLRRSTAFFEARSSWNLPSMAGMSGTRVVGRRARIMAPRCIDGPATWQVAWPRCSFAAETQPFTKGGRNGRRIHHHQDRCSARQETPTAHWQGNLPEEGQSGQHRPSRIRPGLRQQRPSHECRGSDDGFRWHGRRDRAFSGELPVPPTRTSTTNISVTSMCSS